MGYNPPGLGTQPDDNSLAGFGSLMPTGDGKPGIVGRILRLPLVIISLPFRAVKALLGLPRRLFGRGDEG